MRWRRLLETKVLLSGDAVLEESFWSDFAMPLANLKDVKLEWIPYGNAVLLISSGVGNRIVIAINQNTEDVRTAIGEHIAGTPLARRISDATREALMLPRRDRH